MSRIFLREVLALSVFLGFVAQCPAVRPDVMKIPQPELSLDAATAVTTATQEFTTETSDAASAPVVLPKSTPKPTPVPFTAATLDTHIMPKSAPPDRRSILSIVYNGYRRSSLEPCGCVSHKLGGIDKEARVLQRIHELSIPVLKVDAGGYVRDMAAGNAAAGGKYILGALAAMDFDVINIGFTDAAMGSKYLKEALGDHADRLVSANIVDATSAPLFANYRIVPLKLMNGETVKVGVTGVTRPRVSIARQDSNILPQTDCIMTDPATALKAVLPELKSKSDIVVLLAYENRDVAKNLLSTLDPDNGIDVVVAGEFIQATNQIDAVQGARLVSGGFEGRQVGHLVLDWKQGKIANAVNQLVEIVQNIEPVPRISEYITRYLADIQGVDQTATAQAH